MLVSDGICSQVALMQASMMMQMGWPLPEGAGQDDGADVQIEAEGRFIDIIGKLSHLSIEGLALVEKAVLAAAGGCDDGFFGLVLGDCLRLQLATVKLTLEAVSDSVKVVYRPAGDDLEYCIARSLSFVDDVLREQAAQETIPLPKLALKSLGVLQRHMQDISVLVCSRGIPLESLTRTRRISRELESRLEKAFGRAVIHFHGLLWSRLGNSKHQLFHQGLEHQDGREPEQQRGRRGRRRRGGPTVRQSGGAEDEADATAVASGAAEGEAGATAGHMEILRSGEPMTVDVASGTVEDEEQEIWRIALAIHSALGEPIYLPICMVGTSRGEIWEIWHTREAGTQGSSRGARNPSLRLFHAAVYTLQEATRRNHEAGAQDSAP